MKNYLLAVLLFGFISQIKSQSKKEIIQSLSLRVDSLSNTILEERNSNDKQLKYFENLIISLNNEKQKLQEQIKDLEADIKFKDQKLSSIQFTLDSLTEINRKLIYFPKDTVILEIKPTPLCDIKPTKVVDVTNPKTGKTWMDRNLGASRAATSSTDEASYGDLYQWGRGTDGHQCRNSATTSTLSSTDQHLHSSFILAPTYPFNWRSPQNDNLWQGVNGVNNPCPSGYRLPTKSEFEAERKSWAQNNNLGAFGSPLKLPMAGYRNCADGSLNDVGSSADYWGSTVNGTYAWGLGFFSGNDYMSSLNRAYGFSVRCLKD